MADKQAQALERLTAKLSALRKTLRGEERKLLDSMVLSAQSEVSAHSKTVKPIARPTARPSARVNLDSDVELHSASVRRITTEAKTPRPSARKSAGPEATKTAEAEGRQFMRITLSDGNYRVTIL